MAKEIELRQHLGQLPRDLGHVRVEWQATWVVEQVISVLERHDVSVDVFRELEEIVAPSDATDSDA